MERNDIVDSNGRLNVGFWSNHFSISMAFFPLSFIALMGIVIDKIANPEREVGAMPWWVPLLLPPVGVVLWFVQRRKLRFRTLGTTFDVDRLKAEVREIMTTDDWDITVDTTDGRNRQFIRAVYRHDPSVWTHDMVTLQFTGREVLYNVIHDPDDGEDDLLGAISLCLRGKRLINKIKEQNKIETI
jgi:hypothetical protein